MAESDRLTSEYNRHKMIAEMKIVTNHLAIVNILFL